MPNAARVQKPLFFSRAVAGLVLFAVAAACDGSGSPPTRPSAPTPSAPTPPPAAQIQLAVFSDPASTFTTSDVRDVQDQIVRFDTASTSLIWAADGRSFPGYPVAGNFVGYCCFFQVRFGTKDGERQAYLTDFDTATIWDIEIVGGQLTFSLTNVRVPGS